MKSYSEAIDTIGPSWSYPFLEGVIIKGLTKHYRKEEFHKTTGI